MLVNKIILLLKIWMAYISRTKFGHFLKNKALLEPSYVCFFFFNVFSVVAFILKGRVEELRERPYSLQSWNNSLAFYKKSLLTIALKKPLSNYYYYITGNYYILLRFKLWLSATCNSCSASFLQLSQSV